MAFKLTYHHKLYHSDSITENELEKMKKKLEKNPLFCNVYLIVPAGNEKDLLEFYHSRQLAQAYYRDHSPYIIGIARNYGEAVLLVQQLVQECLNERGDCALREYLLCLGSS